MRFIQNVGLPIIKKDDVLKLLQLSFKNFSWAFYMVKHIFLLEINVLYLNLKIRDIKKKYHL